MTTDQTHPRNPMCGCGHRRTEHNRNKCGGRLPNGKDCDCPRKYMDF